MVNHVNAAIRAMVITIVRKFVRVNFSLRFLRIKYKASVKMIMDTITMMIM
jgi:hypothetical protein